MYKLLLGLLLFILPSFLVYGQDSLLTKYLAIKNEADRASQLAQYAQSLEESNPKQALKILEIALPLSQKIRASEAEAISLRTMGRINFTMGNYLKARSEYDSSLQLYKKTKDSFSIASVELGMGTTYDVEGKSDSAMYYYMSSMEILERSGKNSLKLDRVYHNLGNLYSSHLDNHDMSIVYFKKSEQMARAVKDTFGLIASLNGLLKEYLKKGDVAGSYKTSLEALHLAKLEKNNLMTGWAYDYYSKVMREKNELVTAVQASDSAIKYALLAEDAQGYLIACMDKARAYKIQGNNEKAIEVLEKTLVKCKEEGDMLRLEEINTELAPAYYAVGKYKQAYDAYDASTKYKDSTTSEENRNIIASLDMKYQSSKKEKELSQKQLQIANKDLQLQKSRMMNYGALGGLVIALLVIGLLYINYRNRKRGHLRELRALQQEREIQLLQALMNGEEKERSRIAKDLHDGVAGMLAAVKMHFSSLAVQDRAISDAREYKQGIQLLNEASTEIRKTSHNLMPEVLIVHGLDEALRRYCNNISNDKVLSVQYDFWGDTCRYKSSFELSVYRIVQELLNNIIKHSRASSAIVQMSHQNNILSITIEDNGIGFRQDNQDGMGVQSLKSRVRAMNGRIELESENGGGVSAYLEFETAGLVEAEKEVTV